MARRLKANTIQPRALPLEAARKVAGGVSVASDHRNRFQVDNSPTPAGVAEEFSPCLRPTPAFTFMSCSAQRTVNRSSPLNGDQTFTVRTYIREQEKHHQKRTFQDEYLEFLKKHGIEFDERYLW